MSTATEIASMWAGNSFWCQGFESRYEHVAAGFENLIASGKGSSTLPVVVGNNENR